MLVILLCVEALEDNEVFITEGVLQVSKISNPRGNTTIERMSQPQLVLHCIIF